MKYSRLPFLLLVVSGVAVFLWFWQPYTGWIWWESQWFPRNIVCWFLLYFLVLSFLEFLMQLKEEITTTADKKTSYLTWVGLGLMSVQFGVLARLTWWEYSWDIMEPVTYFVTYGTAMAAYAYYCLTKQVKWKIYQI